MILRVFVGFDPRETLAYKVCVRSLRATARQRLEINCLTLPHMQALGLYRRPIERRGDQLYDPISHAPMSTEFAISRFLVPRLCPDDIGYAVFCDSDFLWRRDVHDCVAEMDPRAAIGVVKHDHQPAESTKMRGQAQTTYRRKNWSSLMVWNLGHPAHQNLTDAKLQTNPGRDLHAFNWLRDDDICDLDPGWNWLAGVSKAMDSPAAVHYTLGTPDVSGRGDQPFADEWWQYAREWYDRTAAR